MKAGSRSSPFVRIVGLMGVLTVLGGGMCGAMGGTRGAVSFLAGVLVSALSFWSLHYVGGMVTKPQPSTPSIAFLMLRLAAIAGITYGILRAYEVYLPAMVAGLLVSVSAITLEALYELIYARA